MAEPDILLIDEVKKYIKQTMLSEGVFYARKFIFPKYSSKVRERGMYELIQNNCIEKNIIVLYRNVFKCDLDDDIFEYANSKIPFIFLNINTIKRISNEKNLILEFESFSGEFNTLIISKEEYDDILGRLRLLKRYDILLKIGA